MPAPRLAGEELANKASSVACNWRLAGRSGSHGYEDVQYAKREIIKQLSEHKVSRHCLNAQSVWS